MAENKKYYWLRLKNNFFKQKEIKKLRRIAGGDTYTVIYLKLQLLSLTTDAKLYFDGIEDTFVEELALELDEDVENVRMTLLFLEKHNLIVQVEEDEYLLPETLECIGKETASTQRSRKSRENKKAKLLQCNTNATKSNTEIELEIESEIEKDSSSSENNEEEEKLIEGQMSDKNPPEIREQSSEIREQSSDSSSEKIEEEEGLKEIMLLCQRADYKLRKVDANKFIESYGIEKVKAAIVTATSTVAFEQGKIKSYKSYLASILNDLSKDKKVDITITKESKKDNFNNYQQRDLDIEDVENNILGWYED